MSRQETSAMSPRLRLAGLRCPAEDVPSGASSNHVGLLLSRQRGRPAAFIVVQFFRVSSICCGPDRGLSQPLPVPATQPIDGGWRIKIGIAALFRQLIAFKAFARRMEDLQIFHFARFFFGITRFISFGVIRFPTSSSFLSQPLALRHRPAII